VRPARMAPETPHVSNVRALCRWLGGPFASRGLDATRGNVGDARPALQRRARVRGDSRTPRHDKKTPGPDGKSRNVRRKLFRVRRPIRFRPAQTAASPARSDALRTIRSWTEPVVAPTSRDARLANKLAEQQAWERKSRQLGRSASSRLRTTSTLAQNSGRRIVAD
jgi:hypothetical protein